MTRYWIQLSLFFVAQSLFAQNPGKYILQKISVDKGLSQSVVTGITQDTLGFMWFSTLDGVNRYDGYKFENFYNQRDNEYSLPNNFANTILCDNQNQIWIGTLDGLCKYDYETERFTTYRNIKNDTTSITNNEITCLALSKSGNIWVGTNNGGLNLFDKKTGTFKHYRYQRSKENTVASNYVEAIYEDNSGRLWVGHFFEGIDCIDLKSQKIKHIPFNNIPGFTTGNLQIRCIYQDFFGNNWYGTSNGIIFHNIKENTYRIFNNNPQSPCSINGNKVNSIMCDAENNLWIGTEENGLNIISLTSLYSNSGNICFNQIGMQENEFGLSIRTVLNIYSDRDNNIWIGTYSGGINFVSSIAPKFQKYQHNPYDNNTIGYPKVWGLCEDTKGNIWIGTDGAGLDKLNRQTGKIEHYRHSKNNFSSVSDNAILCALRDSKNNLWFGTYQGGLCRYIEKSNSFVSYRSLADNSGNFPHNDVRVVYEDPLHNLWAGTNGGGLCRYNYKTDKFDVFTQYNSSLTFGNVRSLVGDSSGILYVGTYSRGLDVFNPKTGKTINYSHQRNDPGSLSDNYIYSLAPAKNGCIWVGTGNGLNLFDPKTGKFEVFNERNGLVNNYIHSIITDNHGFVWVSTNKGISRFNTSEKKFENFDSNDGLQNGEFLDGSVLYTSDGLMWFGGINGLNSFNPEEVSKSPVQTRVILTLFQLFNTPVKPSISDTPISPLKKSVCIANELTLNYKQSVFTINFVGLNYSFPEKTKYAYKLRDIDPDWIESGNRRSATYRDLPAGTYYFEVKASNQDGVWGSEITSLKIIILPPYWKTWWAYLIYLILFFGLTYLVFRYSRKQQMLKSKLLLEQVSHQKDQELNQERFRFFTNISHEFRTPLTLILGPVEELLEKENPESPLGRKLSLIFKNARKLLDLINMLLDFRKVETGNMELRITQGNLVKFARDMVMSYHDAGAKKDIEISFHSTLENAEAWFDREKMEIIFNNLISNALKFTPSHGKIAIYFQLQKARLLATENDIYSLEIVDSGIGIAPKHLPHIFESYYSLEHSGGIKGTGIGLALTKSLVELHGGKIAVSSSENNGSTFRIELFKGNTHFNPQLVLEKNISSDATPNSTNQLNQENFETKKTLEIKEEDLQPEKEILLIVEDDPDVREYIAGSFAEKFIVIEAENGVEALSKAGKMVPDIIISDVMMPEMDGIEFCKQIKTNISTSHIPVILLTARTSVTHKKEGYETGADSYVTKPFSIELLNSRVENLIESRKQLKNYFTRAMLMQPSNPGSESPDERFIKQLVELIEQNISSPDFDITTLANELGMSRPVVYRKVKALTNYSIIEFIRTVKMNRAAQLLKTGHYRVSEVAYAVGFNDPKYFTRCFKEQFDINPSDIAKNQENLE